MLLQSAHGNTLKIVDATVIGSLLLLNTADHSETFREVKMLQHYGNDAVVYFGGNVSDKMRASLQQLHVNIDNFFLVATI